MLKKTLFLGYGNPDRGDDGAAWHILTQLFKEHGNSEIDLFDSDVVALNENIDVWFNFQLLPEISETLASYQKAVFLDAHTGEIKEDINFQEIRPVYQNSPFTHHMTPASLLALADSINGKYPKSWLLSVRGFSFKFERGLTPKTNNLCDQALELLRNNFLK